MWQDAFQKNKPSVGSEKECDVSRICADKPNGNINGRKEYQKEEADSTEVKNNEEEFESESESAIVHQRVNNTDTNNPTGARARKASIL